MDPNNTIWFQHYEKPVATKKVLHSDSALAWSTKRNVAVEECVRRLRNCSPNLPWDEKAAFLSEYMGRLKQAGYSQSYSIGVVRQAMARFSGMVKADQEGSQPLYRDRSWYKDPENQKKTEKEEKLDQWL